MGRGIHSPISEKGGAGRHLHGRAITMAGSGFTMRFFRVGRTAFSTLLHDNSPFPILKEACEAGNWWGSCSPNTVTHDPAQRVRPLAERPAGWRKATVGVLQYEISLTLY